MGVALKVVEGSLMLRGAVATVVCQQTVGHGVSDGFYAHNGLGEERERA